MVNVIKKPRIVENRKYKIGEIIIENIDIVKRIGDLAKQIAEDYKGKEVMLIGIMNGAFPTMTVLMQSLHKEGLKKIDTDFITVESYGSKTTSERKPRLVQDVRKSQKGKHVIIVDDIADSGKTLNFAQRWIIDKGSRSVETFALVDKKGRKQVDHRPTYVGFIINDPDLWLQGFGMDSMGIGRGDPHIRRGHYDYKEASSVT